MSKVKIRIIFDLSIKLPNIELKNPNVTIQDFLDIDDKMAESLKDVFNTNHHLNLAELIVEELIIKGEINSMFNAEELEVAHNNEVDQWFNIRSFTKSLKKLQNKYDIEWDGYFELIEPQYGIDNEYIFRTPKFEWKEVGYWLTRQGRQDHEGWQHHQRQFEADERNYQEGRTNEDGDWVDH